MKLVILALLVAAAFAQSNVQSYCSCNRTEERFWNYANFDERCQDYPKSGEFGFNEGCKEYEYSATLGLICASGECEDAYIRDPETSRCVAHGIANCISGAEKQTTWPNITYECNTCSTGHYVAFDKTQCNSNPGDVNNCDAYQATSSSATKCISCERGFKVNGAGTSCDAVTVIPGCTNYTKNVDNSCEDCGADSLTLLKQNARECTGLPVNGTDSDFIEGCSEYYWGATRRLCTSDGCGSKVRKSDHTACLDVPISTDADYVENCNEYRHTGSMICLECASGHLRKSSTNKLCKAIPTASGQDYYIEGCTEYKWNGGYTSFLCEKCAAVKRDNEQNCHDAPTGTDVIEDCAVYGHTGSTYYCQRCNDHFYLKTNQKCEKVRRKIENCEVYLDKLTCNSCKDDHFEENGECKVCPSKEYTPPVECPAPGTPGSPGNPTNGTNTSANVLSVAFALLLVVLLA